MSTLIIHGSIPSKKNSRNIFCRGGFPISLPSNKYREWHEDAMKSLIVPKELRKIMPVKLAGIEITIYPRTRAKSDLTNKAESLMDFLVDAGILEDDNWFVCPQILLRFGGVDGKAPRAEISIST